MADEMMVKELEEVVVRFSGDSGDGMQLAGNIFSNMSATVGNDICTCLLYTSPLSVYTLSNKERGESYDTHHIYKMI